MSSPGDLRREADRLRQLAQQIDQEASRLEMALKEIDRQLQG